MHTIKTSSGSCHYNPDLSGTCTLRNDVTGEAMMIPCADLLAIVARWVTEERARRNEAVSDPMDVLVGPNS